MPKRTATTTATALMKAARDANHVRVARLHRHRADILLRLRAIQAWLLAVRTAAHRSAVRHAEARVLNVAVSSKCPPDIRAFLYRIVEQVDRMMGQAAPAEPAVMAFRVLLEQLHRVVAPEDDEDDLLAWFTTRHGDGSGGSGADNDNDNNKSAGGGGGAGAGGGAGGGAGAGAQARV